MYRSTHDSVSHYRDMNLWILINRKREEKRQRMPMWRKIMEDQIDSSSLENSSQPHNPSNEFRSKSD